MSAKLSKFGWLLLDYTGPRCDDDVDAPINKCSSSTSIYCNNAYFMKHDNMNDDVVCVQW